MKRQMKSKKDLLERKEYEKNIVELMIKLYCKGHKHSTNIPCKDCKDLIDYSNKRVDLCPFMETKTFCQNCTIHCYNEEMREKIRVVMRYSGPRMIFHHPFLAIKHAISTLKEKKNL